jgi:hypothetical protein
MFKPLAYELCMMSIDISKPLASKTYLGSSLLNYLGRLLNWKMEDFCAV